MRPHLKREAEKCPSFSLEHNQNEEDIMIPFLEEWKSEKVTPFYFDSSYCLVREVSYPLSCQHGKYRFDELNEVVRAWNQKNIAHPLSAAGHKPEDLFFFDTETTGLGGGAGNTIFLLGHASISGSTITLKQHFLPHPGAEIPFYQSFLESIDYTTLVTYNGKAFDWPQVKTRHTLIRDHVPILPQFGHFDLYHSARRMWKHRLERIKLTTVEKEVLGIERKDDIPGFLAPMIYFDFLERKHPEGIIGIIKHNELDILSLVTLYIHLSYQLLRMDNQQSTKETYEVGRWYATLGQTAEAKAAFQDILQERDLDSIKAMNALAFEFKRSKELEKAMFYWKEVVEKGPSLLQKEACIELAKIYEHKMKDITLALKYSELAQGYHEVIPDQKEDKFLTELRKRINRLSRKSK